MFFTNLQDVKSNSYRITKLEDDLQRSTTQYMPDDILSIVMKLNIMSKLMMKESNFIGRKT